MPAERPRPLLMGAPVMTGLAQVRDPRTGTEYFVPCNPCAVPTPKTAVLEQKPEAPATPRAPVAVAPATVTVLDARTVATLATPVEVASDAPTTGQTAAGAASDIPAAPVATTKVDATPAPVPEPTPALAASIVPPSVRPLLFSKATATLGDAAKAEIAELLPLASKAERIYIRGRTDSTGTPNGNRALAAARAASVRAALVAAGINPQRLKVSSCTTCYAAPNDTEAGRSANRRVEIELMMPAVASAETR